MTTDRSNLRDPHAPGFRYARWPIGFGFARHTALHTLDRHGWPGSDGNYGQTLHIGPLKVYLGRVTKSSAPQPGGRP